MNMISSMQSPLHGELDGANDIDLQHSSQEMVRQSAVGFEGGRETSVSSSSSATDGDFVEASQQQRLSGSAALQEKSRMSSDGKVRQFAVGYAGDRETLEPAFDPVEEREQARVRQSAADDIDAVEAALQNERSSGSMAHKQPVRMSIDLAPDSLRVSTVLSRHGVPFTRHEDLLRELRVAEDGARGAPPSNHSKDRDAPKSRLAPAVVMLAFSFFMLAASIFLVAHRGGSPAPVPPLAEQTGAAAAATTTTSPRASNTSSQRTPDSDDDQTVILCPESHRPVSTPTPIPTFEPTPDNPCLGFEPLDTCPTTFFEPYADGVYPTTYDYSGTFPDDFVWGLGTAAYQIEGGYNEDGRGASIWDTFTGANTVGMPGSVCTSTPCPINAGMGNKGATGNVACDHYHVWEQDVALMQELGLKHYRFSISWPRVVPTGKIADGVNEAGLAFYDGLIDALIAAGITPYVTLYHWDLPQGLLNVDESLYGWYGTNEKGHPSGQMTEHFVDYADLCFSRFGDRVKTWITFNEAWTFLKLGGSIHAPGMLEFSDSLLHPFIGGHNVLLAHASATKLYRKQYQASQGGKIGMTNNCDFREPGSNEQGDIAASQRLLLWMLGWLSDPIWLGDYPAPMRVLLGDKLPVFTPEERALVVNSSDFFGLNHYGTGWGHRQEGAGWDNSFAFDTNEGLPRAQSTWLFSAAWGFRKLLNWVDKRYGSPGIYVTEGGWSLEAEDAGSGKRDLERTMYFANYTSEMLRAIQEDGVQVKGYFAWSLMDNFEWGMGYKERFGVVFNDFKFGLDLNTATNHDEQPTAGSQIRTPKDTSCWFKQGLWKSNSLIDPVAFSRTGGCDSWVRPMATGTEFGVNVGGWLHLEEWFFSLGLYDKVAEDRNIAQGVVFPPHFSDGFGQTWASEGDLIDKLIAAYGEEAAIDAVLAHRAEYITEAEIKLMATTAVVTSVRLPLGWWAFVEEAEGITRADGRPSIVTDPVYSDRKFVAVTHDYLIGILEMFARNGLTVLLDLHAFPGGSSDGSYNGIWPYDPVFFLQDSLKAQGLDIVRRFCDFYNALPAYLKVTVSSVSIMNEPAHMLPAQTYSMFGWLAQACDVYRTSVVDVATDVTAPLLFVSLINTAPSIQEIVQFFIDTFTESELAEWAVMDIHHYFAWNSFASTCYDTSVPGCSQYQCSVDVGKYVPSHENDWNGWVSMITSTSANSHSSDSPFPHNYMYEPTIKKVACSEFSLSTFHDSVNACRGKDTLQVMYDEQRSGFVSQGLHSAYFWTWRMPYGGSHEAAWSLKHFLTGIH